MSDSTSNWERISLHRGYLQDDIRNLAYKKAITAAVNKDSVVVDLGCGTGILGFFALQAGCKKLYAVESSNMIHQTRIAAERNGFSDRIEFIHSDIFKCALPEKVDVIIHEHIGDLVWDEDMVQKLNYAREHLLKPGGRVLPEKVKVYLAPVFIPAAFNDPQFWKKPFYGLDFSHLFEVGRQEKMKPTRPTKIFIKDEQLFLAPAKLVAETDFYQSSPPPEYMALNFEIQKKGFCTGLLGYMDVICDTNTNFSTGPSRTGTSWGQFFLNPPDQPICWEKDVLHAAIDLQPVAGLWQTRLTVNPSA